jgi:P27 family predicted phage terminase small subunit
LKKSTAKTAQILSVAFSSGDRPDAPRHLSADARAWWGRLVAQFDIVDDGGQLILMTALEAYDRMRGAQAAIARDGATVLDRFGQTKAHPLLPTERDARAAMLAALRQLHLDVEPGPAGE